MQAAGMGVETTFLRVQLSDSANQARAEELGLILCAEEGGGGGDGFTLYSGPSPALAC